jgi:uncharacterized iron-regulated protein
MFTENDAKARRPSYSRGMRRLCVAALVLLLPIAIAAQGYVPERVYDSDDGRFTDFEAMLASIARRDVAFLGEQHDSANTHRLELAVVEGLARRGVRVVLSLEMFERDVQPSLTRWLAGDLGDAEFLAGARPWPRYATDYQPLVDFARARKWPVIAANVPRPIATEVSRAGLAALDARPAAEQAWFTRDLKCPIGDDYFKRFTEAMGGHPAGGDRNVDAERQMVERFYLAQCLKDETMADSIATALRDVPSGSPHSVLVHVTGAFHSDFGEGTVDRVRRRLPDRDIAVVSFLPVEDLDGLKPAKADRKRADFLVYTLK